MIWVSFGLLGLSSLWILIQDIRQQSVSVMSLALFMLAGILYPGGNVDWLISVFFLAAIMLVCQGFFYGVSDRPAFGIGDLILFPLCGFWLSPDALPLFLIISGVLALGFGLFWRYRYDMRTFPMAPPIVIALGVLLGLRV